MTPDWVSDCGRVTLYCGDCLEVLPTFDKWSIDAVVTDPPYGIGINFKWRGKYSGCEFGKSEWDVDETSRVMSLPDAPEVIIWGGNYFPLSPSRGWLVWDKKQEHSGSHAELAWTNIDQPVRTFRMSRIEAYSRMGKQHPTQKPIALMEWCLSFIKGETILDPFMGSGTTIIAAIRKDKKAIGIELDPGYFAIAKKRIQDELAKHPLLETVA